MAPDFAPAYFWLGVHHDESGDILKGYDAYGRYISPSLFVSLQSMRIISTTFINRQASRGRVHEDDG